jgi:hypothetical protein
MAQKPRVMGPPGRDPPVSSDEWPGVGVLAARVTLKLCLSRTEVVFSNRAILHEWHSDKVMDQVKIVLQKSAKETQCRCAKEDHLSVIVKLTDNLTENGLVAL